MKMKTFTMQMCCCVFLQKKRVAITLLWNLFPFSPFFIQSSNQLFWLLLCAAALFALFHLIFLSLRYTRFVRLLLSFAAFACCYCALLANMPTFVLPLISSPKCITMNAPCGAPWTCAHRSYSIATTAFKKKHSKLCGFNGVLFGSRTAKSSFYFLHKQKQQ